jgi:hypothetical protein
MTTRAEGPRAWTRTGREMARTATYSPSQLAEYPLMPQGPPQDATVSLVGYGENQRPALLVVPNDFVPAPASYRADATVVRDERRQVQAAVVPVVRVECCNVLMFTIVWTVIEAAALTAALVGFGPVWLIWPCLLGMTTTAVMVEQKHNH